MWRSGGIASRPCRFTSGERAPGAHLIRGWVGPKACLNAAENRKILHSRESDPGLLTYSPSLYRLSYPDSKQSQTQILLAFGRFRVQNSVLKPAIQRGFSRFSSVFRSCRESKLSNTSLKVRRCKIVNRIVMSPLERYYPGDRDELCRIGPAE
jgi:hypothetical protein